MKSAASTAHTGAGRVPATEITRQSAVPTVTDGNAHPLASQVHGIQSGMLVFIASGHPVNGLNTLKSYGILQYVYR